MGHDRSVTLGAEVDDIEAVVQAARLHRVVVLRRRLDVDEQVRITAMLGQVVGGEPGVPQVRYEDDRRAHPDVAFFNEQWHADLSWCAEGPTVTVLYAMAAGRGAAPTAFVDTVSGFAALPPTQRAEVTEWRARHHAEISRTLRYGRPSPRKARRRRPARRRPPARPGHGARVPTYVDEPGASHPVVVEASGGPHRGVLLGDHAWTLEGYPDTEGRRLLEELQDRVVAVGERYVHHWRPGDLVIFDNRTVLHRRETAARSSRRRLLRRTVAWPT
jgi:alpha-ketoglutarate-dependent taurine dioxygenase